MKTSGIYCLLNTANGKRYIGQSTQIERRKVQHLYAMKHHKHPNPHLNRAFANDGDKFVHQILELCEPAMLDEREKYWIAYYNSTKTYCGYNLVDGGNSNKTLSEETRARLSAIRKGRKLTPEHRAAISRGGIGRPCTPQNIERIRNLWKGRHVTDVIKAAVSASNRNRVVSPETRAKQAAGHKGKHYHTPEFKARLAEYNRTRVLSAETLSKMSASQVGKRRPSLSESLRTSEKAKAARERNRLAKIGTRHTEATRAMMSESHKRRHAALRTMKNITQPVLFPELSATG